MPKGLKPLALAFDRTFVWIADDNSLKFFGCQMAGPKGLLVKSKISTRNRNVGGATYNGDTIWFVTPDDNGLYQINIDSRSLIKRFEGPWKEGSGVTFLEDAWRIGFRLRPLLFGDPFGRRDLEDLDSLLAALHLPFDSVHEIRVLTDDLYENGQYRFD